MHLENRIHTSGLNQPTKEMVQTNDEKNQKPYPYREIRIHKASKPTLWFTMTFMVTQKERRVDALALRADEGRD